MVDMEILARLQNKKNKLLSYLPYTKIVPAILTSDPIVFKQRIKGLTKISDRVDIDVIDNSLIQGNVTLGLEEVMELLGEFETKVGIHFMTSHFDLELVRRSPKIENIVIEAKLMSEEEGFIDEILNMVLEQNRRIRIGISFDPDDNIEEHLEVLKQFDFVQLMTVVPGKQGSPFEISVPKNLPVLFKENISVKLDGGINIENLDSLLPEQRVLIKQVEEVSVGEYFSEVFNEKDN